jgi:uncharacterized protein YhfF
MPELPFLGRYGNQLVELLSTAQRAQASQATTYEDLISHLLLPAKFQGSPTGVPSYAAFQQTGASLLQERSSIARPTLLLTALDDPMHSPELLGIKTSHEQGYSTSNPNLVYMVTEEGGHVGWPTSMRGDSHFLRSTVADFVSSVMQCPRLDFAPALCDFIRNGSKVATMRKRGELDPNSDLTMMCAGKVVQATSCEAHFATIKITRIDRRSFGSIDDDLAGLEGFNSAAELKTALLQFYPETTAETAFDVFHFMLVSLVKS